MKRIGKKNGKVRKIGFILVLTLVVLLIFAYFNYYVKNEEKETEKKPLYFQLTTEQSDEIPYSFESDRTIIKIEKNRIICYGIIRAIKKDDTLNDPEDYEWKENDYFSISLKYDSKFIERYFLQPIEKNGQGTFEPLKMDLEPINSKPYIISSLSKTKETPYYLDETRVINGNQILIKDLISYFNETHKKKGNPDHKIFPIQYKVIFTLEYKSFSPEDRSMELHLLPPISKDDHIYLWVTNKVILEGVKTSEDLLIDEIQPEPPERFSHYVLYRADDFGGTGPKAVHIAIGEPIEPPSRLENFNLWINSHLGFLALFLGALSVVISLKEQIKSLGRWLWKKIKPERAEKYFSLILRTIKQNDGFLRKYAEETYLEVTKLINGIVPPSKFVSKEKYGKNAMVFFMYTILLPFSSAIYTNLLSGDLPACFVQLRLILESMVKCYFADVNFPEKEFFQEKIKALEKKEKNITNLMKKMDEKLDQEKGFEQVWKDLSNEWLHTGGIMNNIGTQIGKKAVAPSWAIIVPKNYSEEDLDDIKKLGSYIHKIRELLKILIEKYKQDTMYNK